MILLSLITIYVCLFHETESLMGFDNQYLQNNKYIRDISDKRELEDLVSTITDNLLKTEKLNCISIITDNVYLDIFDSQWFQSKLVIPSLMVVVEEYEDLLSPNFDTLESLRQVRKDGCQLYIIMMANGMQVTRLLRFGDRHYIGNAHNDESWFDLTTVPFPSPIRGVLVPRRLITWKNKKKADLSFLFNDKTSDLKRHSLHVVALPHVPAMVVNLDENKNETSYGGIEVEIIRTFASAMNFVPKIYEPKNVIKEQWGHKQLNGSFSGLLGEMVDGHADIALGNLHYTPYHLQLTDLTIPYITECLTFLTPESLTDYSWKTLILPFKSNMWIAVLIVLFMSGLIFFALAKFHYKLNTLSELVIMDDNTIIKSDKKNNQRPKKVVGLYLFEEMPNSILYTFGMLLVVSLPKLPSGWSLRMLTGWYWLYCVLVVVSYRASMTAILANPVRRVTIDTINQLADSAITCGGWGDQTKIFFVNSHDESGKKIGEKFETVNSAQQGVLRVAKGELAYFEDIYFLKYLIVTQKQNTEMHKNHTISPSKVNETKTVLINSIENRNLHIMEECAMHMPISIGLQKNSPLKPRVDKLLRRIMEAGLIQKWLNDVMVPISAAMSSDEKNTKALMTLQKLYGGFVALGIGYLLSIMCWIGEYIHWHYFVKRDPHFDEYAIHLYYQSKM